MSGLCSAHPYQDPTCAACTASIPVFTCYKCGAMYIYEMLVNRLEECTYSDQVSHKFRYECKRCPDLCSKQLECGGACRLELYHASGCECVGDEPGKPGTCPA